MKPLIMPLAAGALFILAALVPANAASPVVLELFTSQGCSSCPPADALLQKLSANPDIIALSFHIDYWDQMGWRDPYSLRAATQRQYLYEHALQQENVYTPELVIDGTRAMIGSRKYEIETAINVEAEREKPITVTIAPGDKTGTLSIQLGGTKPTAMGAAGIWLMTFNPKAVTAVRGGENKGIEMTSINNVTSITRIGQVGDTLPQTLTAKMSPDPTDGYAVLVQEASGLVIGAGSYHPAKS